MAPRSQGSTSSEQKALSTPTAYTRKSEGLGAANGTMSSATSTSSKLPPLKNAGAESASPYGTRSRNRTGQSRPNYAEDKDLDTDLYEFPEKKKGGRQSAAASASSHSNNSEPNGSAATADIAAGASSSSLHQQLHQQENPKSNGRKRASPSTTNGANDTESKSHASTPNSTGISSQPSKKRKTANDISKNSSTSTTATQSPLAAQYMAANNKVLQKWQRGYGETNMLSFDRCSAQPKGGRLVADDGTVLEVNDNVYLVCEPPGEPYYLGRIMEFLHTSNNPEKPVDALRVNWFYRPKDIARKSQDTRLLYATMHSDISPLTSLRGKCHIKHRAEIENMDEYRKTPDCFWFEKLYDRYIQKNYEVIPTAQIVNVPEKVKKVLDERWKFILVEQGRGKELTSAVKSCKRCKGYCAINDSVDCAVCKQTYHMNCVKPPLLKKPSRGFAWSCGPCSRAQERKLEARNTPNFNHDGSAVDPDEDDYFDEEEDDIGHNDSNTPDEAIDDSHHAGTAEQIYQASLWPYRYLGMHCKPEDALDYDDRIYPRASSRLGPKHQATVLPWPGRPVQYVKPLEIKRSGRDKRLSKEAQAALEREKKARETRPKWIQDEPSGYVRRGEDLPEGDPNSTCTLIWKPAEEMGSKISSEEMDDYLDKAKEVAPVFNLSKRSTNLLDVARDLLFKNNFDAKAALEQLPNVDKALFKEPELSPAEQKRFEEAVSKYGSELHFVMKHVKTLSPGTVVRYYYVWKKTDRGKQVWGNYSGRKVKKEAKIAEAAANKIQDDVADDVDDSAFDTGKATEKKRAFICKFCNTKNSRQWRRAPSGFAEATVKGKDKNVQYVQALCRRCAELWRRYAIQWEDIEDVAKKVAQAGGRAWKRKVDEELLKELLAANEMMKVMDTKPIPTPAAVNGTSSAPSPQEPPRKKLKAAAPIKDNDVAMADSAPTTDSAPTLQPQAAKKKEKPADKAVEKPPPPPSIPEIPKPKILPCAVCQQLEPLGDQHLTCRECRLAVHRNCYGVLDNRNPGKWVCDMCANDKSPQVAIRYKCVLCPVEYTEHDFIEPPKVSHKKKTEKERERDRIERENAVKAAEYYRKQQIEMNRPVNPREALKRTADNNWVHVTCAVWTPEVKFANARALAPCEGIPSIPRARYGEICKACNKAGGACVACHTCRAPVHVECAQRNGYILGFDITPVKGSRRDQFNIVSINGESGTMTAAVWCKEHVPTKTIVHRMHDVVNESGMNALQLFAQNFKQADLTLTGTARKALLFSLATKMSTSPPLNRRASATGIGSLCSRSMESTESKLSPEPEDLVCITCGSDVSPRWWPLEEENLASGHLDSLSEEAMKFVAQRTYQCHKCKKAKRRPSSLKESPAPVEPPLSISTPRISVPILTSPPPHARSEAQVGNMQPSYPAPWISPRAKNQAPPAPPALAPPPPLSSPPAAPIQPRMHTPIQPPSQAPLQPPMQSGPIQPPRTNAVTSLPPTLPRAPVSTSLPPYSGGSFGDWPRNASQQHGSVHPLSGNRSPVSHPTQMIPPNHLRPPPPMSIPPPMSAPPIQSMQFGPGSSLMNPPSPRILKPPPPLGSGAYLPPFQHNSHGHHTSHSSHMSHPSHTSHSSHSPQSSHPSHHGPHGLGGGPPSRMNDHYQAQGVIHSRHPFGSAHSSTPLSRDTILMSRDGPVPPPRHLTPKQPDTRPSGGASSNPSLRNLLS